MPFLGDANIVSKLEATLLAYETGKLSGLVVIALDRTGEEEIIVGGKGAYKASVLLNRLVTVAIELQRDRTNFGGGS